MTRTRRNPDAERTAIRCAAARLLAGTPLRSSTGRLTGTELIIESGVRRDIVYGDHKDLMEEFQAQAKAQTFTPQVVQQITEENIALKRELEKARAELATEREQNKALVRLASELSLELEQACEELTAAHRVSRLPRPHR